MLAAVPDHLLLDPCPLRIERGTSGVAPNGWGWLMWCIPATVHLHGASSAVAIDHDEMIGPLQRRRAGRDVSPAIEYA